MQEDKFVAWAMQTSKKWSDIESVVKDTGIDFVDHDHRTLLNYSLSLNKVLDESEKAYSINLIKETEKLLVDVYHYTKDHFRREEKFMLDYELPAFNDHKYEHDKILRMLENALSNYKQGKVNITRYLKLQVMEWLVNHINLVDLEYFKIESWSGNIHKAKSWEDVNEIIKLIGNDRIDEQHKEMTELALDVIIKIGNNFSEKSIDENCNRFIDYAKYHFSYEADFMDRFQIKEKEKHISIHNDFINMINHFREKLKEDKSQLQEMKTKVISWWIEHINKTDSKFFAYENWGYTFLDESKNVEEIGVILRKTGIAWIDSDHVKLLELTLNLNNLICLAKNKNDSTKKEVIENGSSNREAINEVLQKIYEYAVEHFKKEEELMSDIGSEDLRSHAKEHERILAQIMEMKENYYKGKIVASSNFKTMILEWWINHTNTTDYKTFVLHSRTLKSSGNGGMSR